MRIQDALMKLLISQPFYGSLATAVSIRESKNISKMEMELSPTPILKYNEEWFENLSDGQAIGTLMHELLHLMLLHSLRRGGRDPLLWSVCCDMAVNDHIPSDMMPDTAVTTEKIGVEIGKKLENKKSAEYYYDILSKLEGDSVNLIQKEDTVTIPFSDNSILEADMLKDENIPTVNEMALKNKIHDLMDDALQSGELPPDMQREFHIGPKRTKIDWKNMFKRFLSGRGRMQIRATYKRDSRRFDGFPGHKRDVGIRVLVALDESGSISDEQLEIFFNELMAINRITNADVLVTEFDTECTEPKPAALYRHQQRREKKGGTDFHPIFKLAEDINISSVVIFTDGEGNAPAHVNQRVLWVLTHNGKQPAPYGYSVNFDE